MSSRIFSRVFLVSEVLLLLLVFRELEFLTAIIKEIDDLYFREKGDAYIDGGVGCRW
jgi:hypothetical protein